MLSTVREEVENLFKKHRSLQEDLTRAKNKLLKNQEQLETVLTENSENICNMKVKVAAKQPQTNPRRYKTATSKQLSYKKKIFHDRQKLHKSKKMRSVRFRIFIQFKIQIVQPFLRFHTFCASCFVQAVL